MYSLKFWNITYICYIRESLCVCSSVVERCPDKTEVEGSIPSTRTKLGKGKTATLEELQFF